MEVALMFRPDGKLVMFSSKFPSRIPEGGSGIKYGSTRPVHGLTEPQR